MSGIIDNHGRPIQYLRLAVTDRCNLRCFYCMPEQGIQYLPKKALLTFEEIVRLVQILAEMGISKIRFTGGEPFVRNDMIHLIKKVSEIAGIEQCHITTNGVLTQKYIPDLKALGIRSVNLSLDSLDRERFKAITRRDALPQVMETLYSLLDHNIPLKINAVVMNEQNTEDILPLVELTKQLPISVRFIEEMPFNGGGNAYAPTPWTYKKIIGHIQEHYPTLEKIADSNFSTSYNYQVPGYLGSLGVIAAYSRTFCGSCNRIRLTAQGTLKTCLYDDGVLDLKKWLRHFSDDAVIKEKLLQAFHSRAKNGFEAARLRTQNAISESMAQIGG